jgi:hypothetical protein
MSPEEFDNRLRSAFKDEHLPPREQLWQNINGRLDHKPSLSLWRWKTPLFAVVAAGLIWLGSNLLSKNSEDALVQQTEQVETTTIISNNKVSNSVAENTNSNQLDVIKNQAAENNTNSPTQSAPNNLNEANSSYNKPAHTSNNKIKKSSNTLNSEKKSLAYNNKPYNEIPKSQPKLNSNYDYDFTGGLGKGNGHEIGDAGNTGSSYNPFLVSNPESQLKKVTPFNFIEEYLKNVFVVENLHPIKVKIDKKEKVRRAIESSGDFSDNKWWLNVGIGPQTNLNKVLTMSDSIDYIHKDLWKIRENLSGSALGFQLFANVQKKFGKKNQFSFETGLEFSHRKEDIKFTDYSYDLRISEKNTGKTLAYFRSLGYLYYNKDTSTFALTEGFSYVNKNTYNVITLPLRFNYELGVSPNSFLSLGFGGGLSYINSNKVGHYNMTTQKEIITSKKYFTGSGNTRLSLYTNYNASVQLGIYGQYQMFMTPLNINNQYKIQMSDIQYGFTCRIPLEKAKF